MRLVTSEEMRTLDRLTIERHGTPGHVLMERAGAGATRVLLENFPALRRKGARALIVAGKGNNGGDGFVIARLLRKRGVKAEVVLLGRAADVSGDAERNLRAFARGRGAIGELASGADLGPLARGLERAVVVVDAIFGTGLNSPVRGLQAEAIEMINASGVPVFAVDIPSGLDANTGLPLGSCIQAEATATFGFAKIGQVLHPGTQFTGSLAVVDIGLAEEAIAANPPRGELMEPRDLAPLVPVRFPDAHKGDCGHVLVISGSYGKTGAPQLVSRAAARAGAGLVTLVGPASLYPVYAAGVLEAMTESLTDRDGRILFDEGQLAALLAGKDAVVIGPGIGTHDDAFRIVAWLLSRAPCPIVLDADALTCLARDLGVLDRAASPAVLTPHPGEMARLTGLSAAQVQADRAGVARSFAVSHGCTLLLKGARTVIAGGTRPADDRGRARRRSPLSRHGAGEGFVWVNPTGNPGMASGGMGDVLSGIIGGLLAQGLTPDEAARLGAYVHGAVADAVAARRGEIGLLASDLLSDLPVGLRDLQAQLDA